METFLMYAGIALLFFLAFGLGNVVETIMRGKVKIAEDNRKAAEANRDAKKYELEASRIKVHDS